MCLSLVCYLNLRFLLFLFLDHQNMDWHVFVLGLLKSSFSVVLIS